jgi:hypothetical protein
MQKCSPYITENELCLQFKNKSIKDTEEFSQVILKAVRSMYI